MPWEQPTHWKGTTSQRLDFTNLGARQSNRHDDGLLLHRSRHAHHGGRLHHELKVGPDHIKRADVYDVEIYTCWYTNHEHDCKYEYKSSKKMMMLNCELLMER